jgi:hypothetical protein
MFKGACRLDDSVHRTIILLQDYQVKKFRPEAYPRTFRSFRLFWRDSFS